MEFPPRVPEKLVGEDAMLYNIRFQDLLRPQWFCRHRQHWPMIPLQLDFDNTLLQPFDYSHSTLPVVRTMDGQYCLFPEVAAAWSQHEIVLENLSIYLNKNIYARPITVEAITWPHHHKYQHSHKDERVVRHRCMLALMRFREHWGVLAYAASGIDWESRVERATAEQRTMGVDPRLIRDLKKSGILDTRTPRVGMLVDISDAEYPYPIARATSYGGPVWFLFGLVTYHPGGHFHLHPRYHSATQKYLKPNPDTDRLSIRLRAIIRTVVQGCDSGLVVDPPRCDIPSLDRVVPRNAKSLPFPGSGQFPGQNFDQFFGDRESENREVESNETLGERARRLSRIDDYNSCDEPLDSYTFFEWIASEEEGFYLRRPISFPDVCFVWANYNSEQRVYDAHHHEIDLCDALGQAVQQEPSHIDISFAGETVAPIACVPESEQQNGREPSVAEPTDAELLTIPSLSERVVAHRDHLLESLPEGVDWVQWRFGFHFPSGAPPGIRFNWRQGLSAGMRTKNVPHPLDSFIADYARILANNEIKPTRQSVADYADICRGHPRYLDPSASFLGVEPLILECHPKPKPAYRLLPLEESSEKDFPWMFVVEEASSVVLSIRHGWGRTRDLLAAKFMEHCLPFHTLAIKHVDTQATQIILPDLVKPLPVRGREALFMDYANYEATREEFFSSPRGRAAVHYGGVMRRLYRADRVQGTRRLQQVISGPTQLAHIIGDTYTCYYRGEHLTLCEDSFTEGEMAVICGQYCPGRGTCARCLILKFKLMHW